MSVPQAISSPCQLICTLDLESGLCFGCARTCEEIALWSRMSEDERKSIMEGLPERMKRFESKS